MITSKLFASSELRPSSKVMYSVLCINSISHENTFNDYELSTATNLPLPVINYCRNQLAYNGWLSFERKGDNFTYKLLFESQDTYSDFDVPDKDEPPY